MMIDKKVLDEFKDHKCINIEKLIIEIEEDKRTLLKYSNTDTERSEAFYKAHCKLIDKFVERLKEKEFPNLDLQSGLWAYDYCWETYSLCLRMDLYECYQEVKEDGAILYYFDLTDSNYSLIEVKADMLTVEEYAKEYKVEPPTVTQWIRRGKIRTAVKVGKKWYIPETTDIPIRGYTEAHYAWDLPLISLPDEYPFLKDCCNVLIWQSKKNKNEYNISCFKAYNGDPHLNIQSELIQMNTKDKEKFELSLIAHPDVRYCPMFYETLADVYMRQR